ncbi:hypothetical protein FQR65_LT20053 [Abscondita terminalis]|nr:hypothetical protein FQR65_LT20053 [Abscondita terminalis]
MVVAGHRCRRRDVGMACGPIAGVTAVNKVFDGSAAYSEKDALSYSRFTGTAQAVRSRSCKRHQDADDGVSGPWHIHDGARPCAWPRHRGFHGCFMEALSACTRVVARQSPSGPVAPKFLSRAVDQAPENADTSTSPNPFPSAPACRLKFSISTSASSSSRTRLHAFGRDRSRQDRALVAPCKSLSVFKMPRLKRPPGSAGRPVLACGSHAFGASSASAAQTGRQPRPGSVAAPRWPAAGSTGYSPPNRRLVAAERWARARMSATRAGPGHEFPAAIRQVVEQADAMGSAHRSRSAVSTRRRAACRPRRFRPRRAGSARAPADGRLGKAEPGQRRTNGDVPRTGQRPRRRPWRPPAHRPGDLGQADSSVGSPRTRLRPRWVAPIRGLAGASSGLRRLAQVAPALVKAVPAAVNTMARTLASCEARARPGTSAMPLNRVPRTSGWRASARPRLDGADRPVDGAEHSSGRGLV